MRLRNTLLTLALVIALTTPSVSHALTNDQILQQIAQLIAHVQSLQARLIQVEGGSGVVGPVISAQNTQSVMGACLNISRTLKRGSENIDVEELQRFLTDTGDYTYGEITGYYGGVTEAAVKRWQAKNSVVSFGTPSSTGYGVVGPATRKAMRSRCAGAAGNEAIARDLVVTPTRGPLPLKVTVTFSLNSSSCSSFSLDWGDGTAPLSFDAGLSASNAQAGNITVCTKDIAHKRATHTYNVPGTHRITLRAIRGPLSLAKVVSAIDVSVGDNAPVGFSLSPTSGSVPFTTSITFPVVGSTCTSFEADWGDGAVNRHEASGFTSCSQDSGTQSLTHTYDVPGTYTVRFKTGHAPTAELPINEQWSVLVKNDIVAGSIVYITPTAGEVPLTVNVDMYGFGEECTSYYLDWGDASSVQEYSATTSDCGGGQFKKTFTHTYIAAGNYSIQTKFGSQSSLNKLPIQTQTILAGYAGSGTIRANCPYPDTPVCGEVTYSCPIGYTCSQVYETYDNRCKMETAGATYTHDGQCNL